MHYAWVLYNNNKKKRVPRESFLAFRKAKIQDLLMALPLDPPLKGSTLVPLNSMPICSRTLRMRILHWAKVLSNWTNWLKSKILISGTLLAANSETNKRPPKLIYLGVVGAYWNEYGDVSFCIFYKWKKKQNIFFNFSLILNYNVTGPWGCGSPTSLSQENHLGTEEGTFPKWSWRDSTAVGRVEDNRREIKNYQNVRISVWHCILKLK